MNMPRFIHQITVEAEDYPGFYVDIVLDTAKEIYYAWLFHEDYGIKDMMYGVLIHNTDHGKPCTETLDSVLEMVEATIDEYIDTYEEEYMD